MKDSEMRALTLAKFYELRHTQAIVQLKEIVALDPTAHFQIANVCDQLAEHSLIEWNPIRSPVGTTQELVKSPRTELT
jgi:hypothetical protein